MSKTGGCLCGAVTYTIQNAPTEAGACHCSMCRKWSGGVYLAIQVPADGMTIRGTEHMGTYVSSDWAERCFCKECGSSLFYRVTAPGPQQGSFHVGMGSLDDPHNVVLTEEIFIDEKPQGYRFANKTHQITGAELMALFAPPQT